MGILAIPKSTTDYDIVSLYKNPRVQAIHLFFSMCTFKDVSIEELEDYLVNI